MGGREQKEAAAAQATKRAFRAALATRSGAWRRCRPPGLLASHDDQQEHKGGCAHSPPLPRLHPQLAGACLLLQHPRLDCHQLLAVLLHAAANAHHARLWQRHQHIARANALRVWACTVR